MKYLETTERLIKLDKMISAGRAISPDDIAQVFQITSRSSIALVNLLKDLGAPIYFCRRSKAYRMAVKGRLVIKWVPESNGEQV
jgi:hypothetical protein